MNNTDLLAVVSVDISNFDALRERAQDEIKTVMRVTGQSRKFAIETSDYYAELRDKQAYLWGRLQADVRDIYYALWIAFQSTGTNESIKTDLQDILEEAKKRVQGFHKIA